MLVHRSRSVIVPIVLALGLAVGALVGWAVTGREWPLLVALVVLLGAVAWAELRTSLWRRTAELSVQPPRAPAVDWPTLRVVAQPPVVGDPGPGIELADGIDGADVEPLSQDDYAELLAVDRVAMQRFQLSQASLPLVGGRAGGPVDRICKTGQHRAVLLSVAHPIWDGPFHGAGSGRCDVREVLVCPSCDRVDRGLEKELGLWPAPLHLLVPTMTEILTRGMATGRPIRLPWLNTSPVQLREELYERPAFHNLMVRVVRAGPPPPPAPSRQPHAYVFYDREQLRHEPPPERPEQRCEVCDQPFGAAIHLRRDEPLA